MKQPDPPTFHRALHCYALAIASVVLAWVIRLTVEPHLQGEAPFILSVPAVLFSAWYCGLGPGVLALVLGGALGTLVQSHDAIWIRNPEGAAIGLALYAFGSLLVISLAEAQRRSARRAHREAESRIAGEQRWAVTLHSVGDAVIAVDNAGLVTFVNPEAERLTGWTQATAMGQPCGTCFHIVDEQTREAAPSPLERALAEKAVVGLANHTILVSRDGAEHNIDDSAAPIRDASGEVIGAVLIFRDITERRTTQRRLEQKAQLVELAHDSVFVHDLENRLTFWNRAAEELYGWNRDDAVGRMAHELLHTRFPTGYPEVQEAVLSTGRWEGELTHTRRDGTEVVVQSRWSLQRGDQGEPLAILEVNRDITVQRQHEEELHRLNRTLRALSRSNHALIRAESEHTYLNEVCRIVVEFCGHSMAWVGLAQNDEGKSVQPVASAGYDEGYLKTLNITWADTERGRGPTGSAVRTGKIAVCRSIQADPTLAPWKEEAQKRGFRSSLAAPLILDGEAIGALTVYSREVDPFTVIEERLLAELADDVAFGIASFRLRAERARAEELARRSRSELMTLYDSAPIMMALLDDDLCLVHANRAFSEAVGRSPESVIATGAPGNALQCLGSKEDPRGCGYGRQCASCTLRAAMRETLDTGRTIRDIEHRASFPRNGEMKGVVLLASTARIEQDGSPRLLLCLEDITERKSAEEQVRRLNAELERRVRERTTELESALAGRDEILMRFERAHSELQLSSEALMASEANYSHLVELCPLPVLVLDSGSLGFVAVNDSAIALYGYTRAEFAVITYESLCDPGDSEPPVPQPSRLGVGNEFVRSARHLRKDGTHINVELAGRSMLFAGRNAVIVIARDVTERVRAREELRRAYEQARTLARNLQAVREEERTLVAREVHDELGQSLTALKLDVVRLVSRLEKPQAEISADALASRLQAMTGTIDDTIQTVRRIATELRPGVLDALGLVAAIEWQARDFQERTQIACAFESGCEDVPLGKDCTTAIFRILQEALTNVARHSQAEHVVIRLESDARSVRLSITDDGVGIEPSQVEAFASIGLLGMRERAMVYGGTVYVGRAETRGTRVSLQVPCPCALCDAQCGRKPDSDPGKHHTATTPSEGIAHDPGPDC